MDTGSAACNTILLLATVVLAVYGLVKWAESKARGAALVAYQQSLAALKQRPADPGLRQQTLELGRRYSHLTRNKQGVTVFDEVALGNDIAAACAGAAHVATGARQTVPCPACAEEILADAKKCRHCGEWLSPQTS